MSTRAFLIIASGLILTLIAFILLDKYRECLDEHQKECPRLGPYVSRSSGARFSLPTSR
jgi:hypothetical protein